MRVYRVYLADKRELAIGADSYQEVDGKFVFFANGEPIPDVFVLAHAVAAITVDPDTPGRVIPQTDESGYGFGDIGGVH
ncbi:MAG TPA: hypothetical protein VK993_05490 [Chthoniobacterales bacterium]|nr:hypothetical protein [Chthoniobacterales bacterium]